MVAGTAMPHANIWENTSTNGEVKIIRVWSHGILNRLSVLVMLPHLISLRR